MKVRIDGEEFKIAFRYERLAGQRLTVCLILRPTEVQRDGVKKTVDEIAAVGEARCSALDEFKFNRETGRKLALERALARFPKAHRKLFWDAYLSRGLDLTVGANEIQSACGSVLALVERGGGQGVLVQHRPAKGTVVIGCTIPFLAAGLAELLNRFRKEAEARGSVVADHVFWWPSERERAEPRAAEREEGSVNT